MEERLARKEAEKEAERGRWEPQVVALRKRVERLEAENRRLRRRASARHGGGADADDNLSTTIPEPSLVESADGRNGTRRSRTGNKKQVLRGGDRNEGDNDDDLSTEASSYGDNLTAGLDKREQLELV